jgi:hypothetical protein
MPLTRMTSRVRRARDHADAPTGVRTMEAMNALPVQSLPDGLAHALGGESMELLTKNPCNEEPNWLHHHLLCGATGFIGARH